VILSPLSFFPEFVPVTSLIFFSDEPRRFPSIASFPPYVNVSFAVFFSSPAVATLLAFFLKKPSSISTTLGFHFPIFFPRLKLPLPFLFGYLKGTSFFFEYRIAFLIIFTPLPPSLFLLRQTLQGRGAGFPLFFFKTSAYYSAAEAPWQWPFSFSPGVAPEFVRAILISAKIFPPNFGF